jgi:DNA-binding transcriptional LysR family regulator
MLNPTWLNTFVTLVDTGHFTKTADILFMTQPGVSQHIRKLEEACGYSLIQRDKKSFEVTEQGRLVYRYAMQLEKNEQALREQLGFDDPFSGSCMIGSSGAMALNLYPQLLDLQSRYPKLVIHLKAAPNHQILDEIGKGVIDIGIVTHEPSHNVFDVVDLGQEELCLVFPASVETERVDLAMLFELGLISHPDAEHYMALYLAQSHTEDFTGLNIGDIPVSGFVNQISQILQPVAKGIGFTVLPKSAVDTFEDVEKLAIFQPRKPVVERLYLVKKKNRPLPARFETVNSVLKKNFIEEKV